LGVSGDGHSLAYHAGAELIDMEFVQFHPTGMVWPPSVMGILVTEGVRARWHFAEQRRKRFMFSDIPISTKPRLPTTKKRVGAIARVTKRSPSARTADARSRGPVYCAGNQARPGQPARWCVPDISWIKTKIANSAEHIQRKLPSMYHQFKQLADIDITREPMEIGPTTHYVMGGIRVDSDTQMSTLPGLFAAGECAAGINGANRLGGNSLSDLLVFGKRAGEFAARYAKENKSGSINNQQVEETARKSLEPFDRGVKGEGPYQIQHDCRK